MLGRSYVDPQTGSGPSMSEFEGSSASECDVEIANGCWLCEKPANLGRSLAGVRFDVKCMAAVRARHHQLKQRGGDAAEAIALDKKNMKNAAASWRLKVLPFLHGDNMEKTDRLLYTSDAADDSLRVDLGGRRITKKKITHNLYVQHIIYVTTISTRQHTHTHNTIQS